MYSLWSFFSLSNRNVGYPFMAEEKGLACFCMEVVLLFQLENHACDCYM